MELESSDALLARLKLGREEYCQRLLTSLVVDGAYPRWNTRSRPGSEGLRFLQRLWALSFSHAWPGDDLLFVDEFELPRRSDIERGGAPDYAVLWPDLVWLIELKTETASHRVGQIPGYFELCRHHHPETDVAITYLTPPGEFPYAIDQPWARYAHVTWPEVAPLIHDVWSSSTRADQRAVIDGLLDALDQLHVSPTEWRAAHAASRPAPPLADPIAAALELAHLTAVDGEQRALDWQTATLEELLELRLAVREVFAAAPELSALRLVMPWTWQVSSGGQAITAAGNETGYEVRLSRYARQLY